MAYYNSVWEQAAAQGQSVFVSTGDSASAGCAESHHIPLLRGALPFGMLALFGLLPVRKRRYVKKILPVFLIAIAGLSIFGCSGGGHSTVTPPVSPTTNLVPAGTYSAVITGTNGATTHNLSLTITVQ